MKPGCQFDLKRHRGRKNKLAFQQLSQKYLYETTHDHLRQTTSGKFTIAYLYTPEEMKLAHQLIDRENKTDYFKTTK